MPDSKPQLKLRATLSVDIDAMDFLDAARYQQEMQALCDELAQKYVACSFDMRERRSKGETSSAPVKQTKTRRPRTSRKPKESDLAIEPVQFADTEAKSEHA